MLVCTARAAVSRLEVWRLLGEHLQHDWMQTRRRRRGNRPPVNTENALSVTNENPEFCSLFHWHVDKTARCVDLRPTISEALLRKTKRNIKLLRTTGKRSLWAWHAAADRFIDAFLCWCCAILYIHTIHTLIQLHRLTHSALRIYSMQILIFPITLSSQLLLAGVASSYVSTLSCLSSIV